MSAGLAALDRGSWAEAKAAFVRAATANPGAPEAADGLARAEAGARLAAIAAHRERAAQLESKEEWRAALAEHEAALALDQALAFALDGRARCEALANLHDSLAAYAARPERLGADEVAREAEREIDRAREVANPGPRLQARIAALERGLATARVPVRVVLRSDGSTVVAVLRVGALGTFEEKAIELKPGTYAVTGSRPGFRDVRRSLVVEPGKPPAPLDVRCGEKL
ncbi:MAG: carboxypeptidase-like regulatory domain-containing protein [Vicinamibacteria bacterium]|nr:carboxypeptidase-like regulatory domain-containing protein [Vicinamibacteria bacterium]